MNVNNSKSSDLISIVGYGTFITRMLWKDKANVEVCLVKNFTRIYPRGSWFPYALKSNSSFKALKFDIKEQELETLDIIEGVTNSLFKRVKIEILLNDNRSSSAFMYIPTEETIMAQNLSLKLDKIDRWKDEIKKFPEIVRKFPKLIS